MTNYYDNDCRSISDMIRDYVTGDRDCNLSHDTLDAIVDWLDLMRRYEEGNI